LKQITDAEARQFLQVFQALELIAPCKIQGELELMDQFYQAEPFRPFKIIMVTGKEAHSFHS